MKKILVIDYDQNSLATIQGLLAKEGYQVVTAADGQAGWDKYNKESPDLVLMEAMLPKVHGFELCQRITSERNSQATVFIMTGVYKDRVYRTEALRTYGASEYFEKPLKMAEVMSSIEAVLGKPEPVPEPAPEPKPVRVVRPEAVMVEARKRDKALSDDERFSLPPDIDELARDIPKARKPAPARRETADEARLASLADELLKSVVVEPAPSPRKAADRTGGGNGNGHESADIDQFLKSALAGLDLDKDKVKVPKPAPRPPAPPPPAAEKPIAAKPPIEKTIVEKPVVERPAFEKPRPSPTPVAEFGFSMPEPATKNTLTPGDPGSDISPFFQPAKPKPEAKPEMPKARVPAPPAVAAAPARPVRPVEKPRPEPIRHEPVRPEPVRHDTAGPEPVKTEVKIPATRPTPSGDIFQHREIFEHVGEAESHKGFPKIVGVVIAVAAVAVAAFLFLRPKPKPAPVQSPAAVQTQTVTQTEVPAAPVEEAPPPEVKSEPVKPKPKPKQPVTKAGPQPAAAESVLAPIVPEAELALPLETTEQPNEGQSGATTTLPAQGEAPAVKTGGADPTAKTGAEAPAAASSEAPRTADPGLKVTPPPAAPPAQEGDLVELGAVTSLPTLVKKVDPIYPAGALQRRVEGSVTVNALIDEKGNVIDTGILKGIQDDMGLGKAAETAVRKWKFEPARKDGVAVKVWKSFVIVFKAGNSDTGASE